MQDFKMGIQCHTETGKVYYSLTTNPCKQLVVTKRLVFYFQ